MSNENTELVLKLANEIAQEDNEKDFMDILSEHNPRVGRAVQLYLTGGFSIPKIADVLGCDHKTVRRWFNKPDIKLYMDEFQKQEAVFLKARLRAKGTDALEKMAELMSSPIDGVALQAAKDLLDRAGYKPEQKVNKQVTVKTFEQKMADALSGIDVDYEEVLDED